MRHNESEENMKKIIAILLAVMLIMAMAVPASACTPRLKIPHIEIPKLEKVEVKLPQSFWDNHFAAHPIILPQNFKFNFG